MYTSNAVLDQMFLSYRAVRALPFRSRLVRLAGGFSSFPLASHHGVLADADALRRNLQTSSQIINMKECHSLSAERVQKFHCTHAHKPPSEAQFVHLHELVISNVLEAVVKGHLDGRAQHHRGILCGAAVTAACLQAQQRAFSQSHCHLLCPHSGIISMSVHCNIGTHTESPMRTTTAPADVGGRLALAGVDGEVTSPLVDANDLALVDVLPRLDEQPAARLDAA